MKQHAILVLEDGSIFKGLSIGAKGSAVGEVVFNTSMTGYQEILTDPSYARQLVTLTYPHIGNTGTNHLDEESHQIHAEALIIRELPALTSNFRSEESLQHYLLINNIIAIAQIDTRRLTRILREKGALSGCLCAIDGEPTVHDELNALEAAKAFVGLKGMDLAKEVTSKQSYHWTEGSWSLLNNNFRKYQKSDLPFHVVAYDFGIKRNILRLLVDRGCHITVVPAQTTAEEVLALKPDGIFLSNGPGDPAPCSYAINATKQFLQTEIPIFGICLGHQILALACGAQTIKMKFGHHGANHPVKDLKQHKVMITAQNHGFAVDEGALPDCLTMTHQSLFDGSLQGLHHNSKPAFSFQGHPEASPGPHDAVALFDHFIELITAYRA